MFEADRFSFRYAGADRLALREVTLAMGAGERLAVVGPMAAGKSTLCLALAGFAPRLLGGCTQGQLRVLGRSTRERGPAEGERVGLVFEDQSSQLLQLRILDEVTAPLRHRGMPPAAARRRAEALLAEVGLGGGRSGERPVWELGVGEQQMLALAATLALDPRLLVLDNVTRRLGIEHRARLKAILHGLGPERSVVLVEHRADVLLELVDRVCVLDQGRVVAVQTPAEVLRDDALRRCADLDAPAPLALARTWRSDAAPLSVADLRACFPGLRPRREAAPQARPRGFGAAVVRVEDLSFSYRASPCVLRSVSLRVREGEVHAVVGSSGAGKTTLAKLLCGLLRPTRGSVRIDDVDIRESSPSALSERVGTVLEQAEEQLGERTVRDEIAFALRRRRFERTGWFSRRMRYADDEIATWVDRARALVGLDEALVDCDPVLLSRGQRKLVALAAALSSSPRLLLLDDPTAGLGGSARHRIRRVLEEWRERGRGVLLAAQDLELVAEVADTVTVLDRGQVVLQGPAVEVLSSTHWERLRELGLEPPSAAVLAEALGVRALDLAELRAQVEV